MANSLPSHEILLQDAFAEAAEQARAVYLVAKSLEELHAELDAQELAIPQSPPEDSEIILAQVTGDISELVGDIEAPTPLEFEIDALMEQYDTLQALSIASQRINLKNLWDLSPHLTDVEYFGAAAFLYSLNPYLLEQADSFRSQVVEIVAKLSPGEHFVAWGENSESKWEMRGGRIVEVRRLEPSPTGDLGIEIVFQPQFPSDQSPITVRHGVGRLLETRADNGQLRPGWYICQEDILTLGVELFEPVHIKVHRQEIELPRSVENLARFAIAARAADIDPFAPPIFSLSAQERAVEAFAELFIRTRQGSLRNLAIAALESLDEWTPEFRKYLLQRMVNRKP